MTRTTHNDRRLRAGFSLSEVVLALGVLAVGMTMAAALFPAAIKLNEQSTNDSLGTIIAENGLTMAKAMLKASDANEPNLKVLDLADPNFQLYGYDPNDPNTGPPTRGFVVLGRQLDANATAQLVIVSYNKRSPGNTVMARPVNIINVTTSSGGAIIVTLDDDAPVGTPLIVARNGSYAKIIDRDPANPTILRMGVLDHAIEAQPTEAAWVIDESGLAKSPAMAVLVANVMLEQ
jgi:Tfp pilus assembly protein PilV